MEEWRTISFTSNWRNKYEVSNLGRVRNANTKHIIKPQQSTSKRHVTVFLTGGFWGHAQYGLAQIVYNEWVRESNEKPSYWWMHGYMSKGNFIGHKDGNKRNNRADNLYRY